MTLHPRTQHTAEAKAAAHRLLDNVKAGMNISAASIAWALRVTGDLE